MDIALNLPLNRVSFGQVSSLILRTIYEQEKAGASPDNIFLFPIGQLDLSSQSPSEDFQNWVKSKIINGIDNYNRDVPIFKLWHLNGSIESYARKQVLFTFHELDQPTKAELNVVRNNKTLFSSRYSVGVFEGAGEKAGYLPLAFDSFNFKPIVKKAYSDDRIVFNLCGKLEKRKNHEKIIKSWIKKYGNNPRYALHCAVFNPFLNEEQNKQSIFNILQGNKPYNVNFYPMMNENSIYNEFLNSSDIIIGMSGAEGFGLPEFQSVALGKHAVMLKAHAYVDWATDDMVTWVKSVGKIPAYDNMFFQPGQPFNQGHIYDFEEEDFIVGCETAIRKVMNSRINEAGLVLQQTFSKEKLIDNIKANLNDA